MTALAASAGDAAQRRFSPLDLFDLFGAAIRAADAVRSRRQPRREDLLILGITGELPRTL